MKALLTTAILLLAFSSAQAQDLRKFDVYGDLPFSDEKKQHDLLALQMQSEPDFVAWLVVYAPCAGEARSRAVRAKNYLVKKRGIRADRVQWIDSGYDGDHSSVNVWLLPRSFGYPYWEHGGKRDAHVIKNCKAKSQKQGSVLSVGRR